MTVTLTPCTPADLPVLQAVSRATFADTFGAENSAADLAAYLDRAYSLEQLSSELAQPTTQFIFVRVDETVAGYLKVNWGSSQSDHEGENLLEVERIYILPDFKRQGLGRQLFTYAEQLARQLEKAGIWLGVWEHNLPAQKFYQRLGFQEIGDHVFQLGSDAQRDLILRKTLV